MFIEDVEYRTPDVYLRYGYDSLDRIRFPSHGNRFTIQLIHREEDVDGEQLLGDGTDNELYRSTRTLVDWKGAFTHGNHGFIGEASFAFLNSELDQSIQ
ncbi:MAG: NTE family protein [Glaciecola sp.]|uniref:hypothetical protein n=1 Tax=Congregibacter sp. TaxID=2744308 RepID=UPI0039E49430